MISLKNSIESHVSTEINLKFIFSSTQTPFTNNNICLNAIYISKSLGFPSKSVHK